MEKSVGSSNNHGQNICLHAAQLMVIDYGYQVLLTFRIIQRFWNQTA